MVLPARSVLRDPSAAPWFLFEASRRAMLRASDGQPKQLAEFRVGLRSLKRKCAQARIAGGLFESKEISHDRSDKRNAGTQPHSV